MMFISLWDQTFSPKSIDRLLNKYNMESPAGQTNKRKKKENGPTEVTAEDDTS